MDIPVKTCKQCGNVYVVPYIPSLGIELVLTLFTSIIGGGIYWWIRGRGIRCPVCHSRDFDVIHKELAL